LNYNMDKGNNIDIDVNDLYLYDLPEKVLESLELIYFDSSTTVVPSRSVSPQPKQVIETASDTKEDKTIHSGNSCSICKLQFDLKTSQNEKRDHYRSDYHRLNLKRSISNLPPLTEAEFDKLIEEESIESISGSDDSDESESEDESGPSTKLDTIIEKFDNFSIDKNETKDDDEEGTISHLNTNSPFIYFKSNLIPEEKVFGVYKSVFTEKQLLNSPIETLRSFSNSPIKTKKSALFMIGGGHFAGAIISHIPKNIKGNAPNFKESKQEQLTNIIESKTFHRYTTRKKQGGSQSASDNARGKANSAGSSIRRYNEQALIREVRELLASWKNHIDDCTNIYIRANGSSNRKIIVGYEGCVLHNGDDRIRSFPFTTKRATTSELKKAWSNLSYLSIHDMPKSNEKLKKRLQKQRDNLRISQQQHSKKPEIILSENDKHSNELIGFLKKSKAPMLVNYIRKNDLSPDFELSPKEQFIHYPTLLHFASSQGLSHMVQVLMVNLKADPTISNKFGKTPFELAGNTVTRRAFQIARYSLGEHYCDWQVSKVGSPKSREEVEREQKVEQRKIDEDKKKAIEEELAKRTEMEMKKPSFSSGGALGGAKMPSTLSETSGLSEQQKMRIMREQRARAAEARMKKMQGK